MKLRNLLVLNLITVLSLVLLNAAYRSYSHGDAALGLVFVLPDLIWFTLFIFTLVMDVKFLLESADKKLSLGLTQKKLPTAVIVLVVVAIMAILYFGYLWMAGLLV